MGNRWRCPELGRCSLHLLGSLRGGRRGAPTRLLTILLPPGSLTRDAYPCPSLHPHICPLHDTKCPQHPRNLLS